MNRTVVYLFAFFLVACGGGGSGPVSSAQAPQLAPATHLLASTVVVAPAASTGDVSLDTLTWLNSTLPSDQFMGVMGQSQTAGMPGDWHLIPVEVSAADLSGPKALIYGLFRSRVDRENHYVYFRKDEFRNLANSWYGEQWYYDDQHVMLHTETAPWPLFSGDYWDQRPNRFRLFHQRENPGKGRVLAPLTVDPAWSYTQTLDTELCGLTHPNYSDTLRVDGFVQANSGTCPSFQAGVVDAKVTVEVIRNFDFHDQPGMITDVSMTQLPPNSSYVRQTPRVWDAVLVINQYMTTWVDGAAGYARERFFMGYHQGVYYGMVGWDDSIGRTMDNMTVTARAVSEAVLSRNGAPMDFDGMKNRAQADRSLAPLVAPANLNSHCISNSNQILLSWDAVPNQSGSDIRINDLSDPWYSAGNDVVVNRFAGDSYLFATKPGHTYDWWVHGSNESGSGPAAGGGVFTACSGSGATLPAVPSGASAKLYGDIAILSWAPQWNATGYDVRVDDITSDAWLPYSSPNDVVLDDHKGASYLFQMKAGHAYRFWVHSRNAAGTSSATGHVYFELPASVVQPIY